MIKTNSTNWKYGLSKPYNGQINSPTKEDKKISYTGSNGKREIIYVKPERVQIKLKTLKEQGRNPVLIP